jgi:hypothetical protein
VGRVYGEAYGVQFVEREFDLEKKIEGWPDRFLMALFGDKLAACIGLYDGPTYVERFGRVTAQDLDPLLATAGAQGDAASRHCVELTRLTTNREYRTHRVAWLLMAAGHSVAFLGTWRGKPPLVLTGLRLSLSESLVRPLSIACRTIKAFPEYKVHEHYRVADDPMVSRLTIPELDVASRWLNLRLPAELDSVAFRVGLQQRQVSSKSATRAS